MADILIRGMEMPTQCGNCPISTNTRRCTILWREFGNPSKRLQDCPLAPLPEGHGRLVDEKWIKNAMITTLEALMRHPIMDKQEAHLIAAFDTLRVMLDDAPTIVPAEGGGEE